VKEGGKGVEGMDSILSMDSSRDKGIFNTRKEGVSFKVVPSHIILEVISFMEGKVQALGDGQDSKGVVQEVDGLHSKVGVATVRVELILDRLLL